MHNLRKMRARIQPTTENNQKNSSTNTVRKRDRGLMEMVLIEVMFYVISRMPFSIYLIYNMVSTKLVKSKERKKVESFINYMVQSFIMYFNTALPFYIYISTSPSFKRQCKRVIIKFYAFILGKEIRSDDINLIMTKAR